LTKRINRLIPDGASGIAIKNGIEKTSVIIETMYEKFNAPRENNDFFSNIVDAVEKTAEIKAKTNHIILLSVSAKRL